LSSSQDIGGENLIQEVNDLKQELFGTKRDYDSLLGLQNKTIELCDQLVKKKKETQNPNLFEETSGPVYFMKIFKF
jgi:hypothetical protein